jgi:Fur family transcriptional regulator, ferric uptake regulator
MTKRKTALLEAIQTLFNTTKTPQSVTGILEQIKPFGLEPNKTSVYRMLTKLVSANTLSTFTLKDGVTYYELLKNNAHHHHFYCQLCAKIFCLDACTVSNLSKALSSVIPKPGFKVLQHDFNLYGTCDTCVVPQGSPL